MATAWGRRLGRRGKAAVTVSSTSDLALVQSFARLPFVVQRRPDAAPKAIMEAPCGSEDMLAKATGLWTMLDDLAESDPENYRQFMRQRLKEAKQFWAPPEPCLCVKAHVLENTTEKTLFVNICKWNRVPTPDSPSETVPLTAGKMEEVSHKSGCYSIINVAYNPSVLERVKNNPAEKDQLIRLSLKYIEEHCNITLSHSYSIVKFKLKGTPERMRQSLRGEQAPEALSQKSTRTEVTLNQLRNIIEEEESGDTPLMMNKPPAKTCLIEEISCTESPEEFCTPAYEITITKDTSGQPLKIELKVELPGMHRVSECNLSVSKDDVLIECLEKYRLQLDLPETVDEEATAAVFYKKKGFLLITMPVCQSQ